MGGGGGLGVGQGHVYHKDIGQDTGERGRQRRGGGRGDRQEKRKRIRAAETDVSMRRLRIDRPVQCTQTDLINLFNHDYVIQRR